MRQCPACSRSMEDDSRFCPGCGAGLGSDSSSEAATELRSGEPERARPPSRSLSSWSSSSSLIEGRFPPGTMLADRYRIVGQLGKGGMGEVYRADDLKLGQPVALKFLPPALSANPSMLARFHHEVKIARQVSHPNVCRVYDIGEVDGQPFLSMEYVDGEDLKSLLKRIGRLPQDKAIQIARQLCAGLAAAHDKGVLHRDLKPANVMLDGEGRVRITDFGLAGIAGEIEGAEVRSGTPAFMAPEQLAGKEVSVASDVYSLGLVLFELFTGTQAFRAQSVDELIRMQQEDSVTMPSSIVDGLDPAVERVILRCLTRTPAERPSSALAVAAALPGGDPVAAALAAGETPSPAMVAAAGPDEGMRPGVALALVGVVVVGLAVQIWVSGMRFLTNRVELTKRPEVLAQDARNILASLGHSPERVDSAHGFVADESYLDWVEEQDSSPRRWDRLATDRPGALRFWYRQSPRILLPENRTWATVSLTDPPLRISGMANLVLDPEGRLLHLQVVPPQRDDGTDVGEEMDWSGLLAAAGVEPAALQQVDPSWNPEVYCDRLAAWTGTYPAGDLSLRIEAGSYRGKAVYLAVVTPWTEAERMEEADAGGERIAEAIGVSFFLLVPLVGGLLLARRNLRLGRSDRKGAFRLAAFYLIVHMVVWLFTAKHVPSFEGELGVFLGAFGSSLWQSFLLFVLYIALEPYVRRRWPSALVSWTRVLSGRFRDPLVGRDILVGAAVAVALSQVFALSAMLPAWLGRAPERPDAGSLSNLLGVPRLLGNTVDALVHAQVPAMAILFVFLLFRILLRKEWVAGLAVLAILLVLNLLTAENPWITAAIVSLLVPAVLFTLTRFGLLALTVMFYFFALLDFPMTPDLGAWQAGATIVPLAAMLGLAGYGFYVGLAGRPLFTGGLLDE